MGAQFQKPFYVRLKRARKKERADWEHIGVLITLEAPWTTVNDGATDERYTAKVTSGTRLILPNLIVDVPQVVDQAQACVCQ